MSVKSVSYIQAVKNKPGFLIHLGLFAVMCYLNTGVWESLESVLPESAALGHRAIMGESITVFIIIVMAVRGTYAVARRALILLVAATILTVFNFGVHWFYSRDISMARQYVAHENTQGVIKSQRATEQATRVEGVVGALTEFNKSQEKLSRADEDYFRRTGVRRNRKTQSAPDLAALGIVVTPSPTPTPAQQQPTMVSGLVMSPGTTQAIQPAAVAVEIRPLTPEEVLIKWAPWFLFGGIAVLAVVFCGAAYVAATWEWDMNGNGLADSLEGKV